MLDGGDGQNGEHMWLPDSANTDHVSASLISAAHSGLYVGGEMKVGLVISPKVPIHCGFPCDCPGTLGLPNVGCGDVTCDRSLGVLVDCSWPGDQLVDLIETQPQYRSAAAPEHAGIFNAYAPAALMTAHERHRSETLRSHPRLVALISPRIYLATATTRSSSRSLSITSTCQKLSRRL